MNDYKQLQIELLTAKIDRYHENIKLVNDINEEDFETSRTQNKQLGFWSLKAIFIPNIEVKVMRDNNILPELLIPEYKVIKGRQECINYIENEIINIKRSIEQLSK